MSRIQITTLQKNILERYKEYGRKLPWRQTKNPYAIHVSEVMLQQTQTQRVIPFYQKRLKSFPDYKSLAGASKSELLRHWSGLGFNSRAIRLQECAKIIVESGKYKVQGTREELMKLPGIGPYTSAAIMAFAQNKAVPVVDTNIRRVLIFLFKLPENISAAKLEKFAQTLIPKNKSRDWHNALMDFGALELTAKKTKIKSLSKQSKFEGSDRQVRGRVLRQLTTKNEQLTVRKIMEEFPQKDVKGIIAGMVGEKLIQIKKGIISILE